MVYLKYSSIQGDHSQNYYSNPAWLEAFLHTIGNSDGASYSSPARLDYILEERKCQIIME